MLDKKIMNIQIKLVRSKRKTISLTLVNENEALVRAPYGVSDGTIEQFLVKHKEWIEKQRKIVSHKPAMDLSNGNIIFLFGEKYVICDGERRKILSKTVYLPRENREKEFILLMKRFAQNGANDLTNQIAKSFGFQFDKVRISSARGRWGSCNSKKVIAYSFRIAFLPVELFEYVVVHELAHTVYMNHGVEFWRVVAQILPDWKIRRKSLKDYAYLMNLL